MSHCVYLFISQNDERSLHLVQLPRSWFSAVQLNVVWCGSNNLDSNINNVGVKFLTCNWSDLGMM